MKWVNFHRLKYIQIKQKMEKIYFYYNIILLVLFYLNNGKVINTITRTISRLDCRLWIFALFFAIADCFA